MEYWSLLYDFVAQWYFVPLSLLYIAVIVTVLIENTKPEKAIAWILVATFLPGIGLIFYYFFGQEFKRNKRFDVIEKKYFDFLSSRWDELQALFDQQIDQLSKDSPALAQTFQYLINTKNAFPTDNNQVDLLINGEQKFPKLLKDIADAKHHIHLEYYIMDEDELGKKILNLLVQKAKDGVQVRLLIDDFGSSALAKRQKYYQAQGIDFELMLPVRFSSLANSNYRDHRKIVVIDGQIAYAGGMNISKKYNNDYDNEVYWRDTSIRIEGDAVKVLQIQFLMHWQVAAESDFEYDKKYFPEIKKQFDSLPMSFAFSSPGKSIPYTMEVMINSILQAKKSVKLCTPYFIPTDEFRAALKIAQSKGVEVELMLPYESDSYIVQAASMSFLKRIVARGIKVYMYQKGFIHAKTIAIDDEILFVGTTNLDIRSFLINFEYSAILQNKQICAEHNLQFEQDKKHSVVFTTAYWSQQKWYKRAFAALCRLMSPLL